MEGLLCSITRQRLKTRRLPVTVFSTSEILIMQAQVEWGNQHVYRFYLPIAVYNPPIDISAIVVILWLAPTKLKTNSEPTRIGGLI